MMVSGDGREARRRPRKVAAPRNEPSKQTNNDDAFLSVPSTTTADTIIILPPPAKLAAFICGAVLVFLSCHVDVATMTASSILHDYNQLHANKSIEQHYYTQQMLAQNNLTKSARHMEKFFRHKHIVSTLPLEYRFRPNTKSAAGVVLPNTTTTDFSYLHIWKSGGTTMSKQVGGKHGKLPQLLKNKLITFVRDPLDHFFSGWVECLSRWHRKDNKAQKFKVSQQLQSNVSGLLLEYLEHVRQATKQTDVACAIHSYPQVNFLLAQNQESLPTNDAFFPQLRIIGDLLEMKDVLQVIDFAYNESLASGKNASEHTIKKKHFQISRDEIDDEAIRQVCDFVALDYYLLDYELPEPCKSETSKWNDSLFMRLNISTRT